jgi:acyl-CoA thioesterase FadM
MEIARTTTLIREILPEHIDLYGHLNNGNYGFYFEQGRKKLQEYCGISDEDLLEEGHGLLVIKQEIVHKLPVFPEDRITIISHFEPYEGGARLRVAHALFGEEKLSARAITAHAFIDLKTGKPLKLSGNLSERIRNFLYTEKESNQH